MIKIPYLEPSLDLTGRHKCNTTDFSRISADLLRHGKTIIGEEDDKLVSMTAHYEFHLSS